MRVVEQKLAVWLPKLLSRLNEDFFKILYDPIFISYKFYDVLLFLEGF